MIEERQDVLCALAESERTRRIRRPSMSAQVRHDHSVSVQVFREHVKPVRADSHTAVKEQQRFAGATVFEGTCQSRSHELLTFGEATATTGIAATCDKMFIQSSRRHGRTTHSSRGFFPGFAHSESTANRRVTLCDVAALEPSLTEDAAGLRDLSPWKNGVSIGTHCVTVDTVLSTRATRQSGDPCEGGC